MLEDLQHAEESLELAQELLNQGEWRHIEGLRWSNESWRALYAQAAGHVAAARADIQGLLLSEDKGK